MVASLWQEHQNILETFQRYLGTETIELGNWLDVGDKKKGEINNFPQISASGTCVDVRGQQEVSK